MLNTIKTLQVEVSDEIIFIVMKTNLVDIRTLHRRLAIGVLDFLLIMNTFCQKKITIYGNTFINFTPGWEVLEAIIFFSQKV